MKRYSHLLAGASWMTEYVDPDTEDWEHLRTFSPYHLLTEDRAGQYPPTFVLTSTRDDRVHPGHARKFTAAMESLPADVRYWENIRSEEHTSELQSRFDLVCRLLLEKKKNN